MEDYITLIFDKFIELRGDRVLTDDQSVIGGFGWVDNKRVVLISCRTERLLESRGLLKAEAYRKGLRLVKLAEHLRKPIVVLLVPFEKQNFSDQEEYSSQNAAFDNVQKALNCSVPIAALAFASQNHWGVLGAGVYDKIIKVKQPIAPQDWSKIKRSLISALSRLESIPITELIQGRLTKSIG
jgi:acetyl-CoA carboxylase carboxyl transferase subunit alpha